MAINKRKVLDGARKLAQKGAKQKALKEYNKLVQADPRDAKLLLEIGDVYRRWGQAEEAIAQYTKVANQYKQDGFDARAVAVLKQILNLDPKRYTAHVALAELYQRMGLDSDAVGALRTAADGYYRDGRRREALELLRRMASLDPSNTTSRMKVADLLRQEGMEDDAVNEYEEVAEELRRQGASEQICVVQERILEIRPDRVATLAALARNLSDLGRPERAEPFAVRALEKAPEPDHFELLAGIYKSLGNDTKLAAVTRDLAAYHRGRGDEDRAREVLQRLPPESVLGGSPGIGRDKSEFDEPDIGEDELLDDEDFLVTDASDESEVAPAAETGADVSEDDLPEGDPEQLLAEASVYLRYGKRTQAIASLRSALRQDPAHRGVLEKLGEAYAEDGRDDEAIGCWQQAAECARADGDAAGFAVLRDRVGALDPAAAAEIEPMDDPGVDGDDGIDVDVADDEGIDVAFDDDDAQEEAAATDPSSDGLDLDVEIDMGDDEPPAESDEPDSVFADAGDEAGFDLDSEMAADESGSVDAGIEIDLDLGEDDAGPGAQEEVEIDIDDAMSDVDDEPGFEEAGSAANDAGQSTTTAAQIQGDLEEAEFYLEQGLDDEAEGIYRRILEVAPSHPTALLKLGELVARRGDDPGAISASGLDVGSGADETEEQEAFEFADDSGLEIDVELDGEESDTGPGAALSEDLAAVLAEAEASVDDDDDDDATASGGPGAAATPADDVSEETERQLAVDDDAMLSADELFADDATEVETLDGPGAGAAAAAPFAAEPVQAEPPMPHGLADDTLPITESADERAPGARAAASQTAAGGSDATFDLAAELADVFGDDEATDPNETSGRSTVEDGFESLFADFKKGVSATLEDGDFDTRFDLGIAYREMGLFDDAISEFAVCLGSPTRKVESLHMMALCAIELGRAGDAVNHLQQALSAGGLKPDITAALQLDLGRAQRLAGNASAARAALDAVRGLDPGFPGLAQEIAALESGAAPAAPAADEGFESFDDLLSDDVSEAEPIEEVEAESFESFDDVITEAEADEPPAPAAQPVVEPAPEPEPDPGASRPGRKKKRISFV